MGLKNILKASVAISLAVAISIMGCKEEPVKCDINCAPSSKPEVAGRECACACLPSLSGWFDAGRGFCVKPGSYVSYMARDAAAHMDTFAIWIPGYDFFETRVGAGIGYHRISGTGMSSVNVPWGFKRLPEGDSLFLDYLRPPDRSFNTTQGENNAYSIHSYRLKMEGFRPGGQSSDTLFARMHYLTFGEDAVRPPLDFVMIRAKP